MNQVKTQKRVMAIHDLSGFGKCSLTIALPVLSASGLETVCLPTALLSTHTGGFTHYTYHDLTQDMLPMAAHWEKLQLHFDALYSGFLGSEAQLKIVSEIFSRFKKEDTLILVDPAMADFGQLYSTITEKMALDMRLLCQKADVIVPNMTEAAFLLGESYREGPYTKAYLTHLAQGLSKLGPKKIVLTGVWFAPDQVGAMIYDRETEDTVISLAPHIPGRYYGTGDLFASALLGGLMQPLPIEKSLRLALDYVTSSILRTYHRKTDVRFGVDFESGLGTYILSLQKAKEETL